MILYYNSKNIYQDNGATLTAATLALPVLDRHGCHWEALYQVLAYTGPADPA